MRNRLMSCLCTLFLLPVLLLTFSEAPAESTPPALQIHQPQIGCAACYLLIADDTVILVDGGTDTDARDTPDRMLDYVAASGIDHINAHVVTHYHNDHAMQIPDFSELYGTEDTIVYGPSESLPERFQPLPHGTYQRMKDGDQLDVGPFHISCIGPQVMQAEGEINADSLNFIVSYEKIKILFTGDFMSGTVWQVHQNELENLDIMVFPHHGLQPFYADKRTLKTVNPKIMLMPGAAEAPLRFYLQEAGINPPVYGDFAHGNVVLLSDGKDITVVENVEPGQFKTV